MVDLRSLLFGSVPRIVATLLVVLVAAVGGGFALGVFGVPALGGVTNAFGDVNETTTAIETELAVANPNPIGVNLGGTTVEYAVGMNEVPMANGSLDGVSIPAGNATIDLTTHMSNERIPAWWTSHVRRGETTTVRISATAHSGLLGRSVAAPDVTRTVETDLLSQFNSTETREVDADQPPIQDPVLYINRTGAAWGEVTAAETPILVRFTVYNPKPVPIPVTELGYNITMNDVAVGSGATERTYTLPPGETRTIRTTTVIRNDRLDEWWVSHLRRNQVTTLRIDFSAVIDTQVAGTVGIPLEGVAYERTIDTDIFGTKNGSPTGDGGTDSGESTAGTTTDSGASEGTTTSVTTTEDGGLLDGGSGNETTEDDGLLAIGRVSEG